jgi:hypothetical protein
MNKYIFKKSHIDLINEAILALKDFNGSYDWLPVGSDWGAGGCRILAEALYRLISSENNAVIATAHLPSRSAANGIQIPHHIYVRCYLSSYECFIDYNGVQGREAFRRNLRADTCSNSNITVLGSYDPHQCDLHAIEASDPAIESTYAFLKEYLLSHRN